MKPTVIHTVGYIMNTSISVIIIIIVLTVVEQGQRGGMMVMIVLTRSRRVTAHARLQ